MIKVIAAIVLAAIGTMWAFGETPSSLVHKAKLHGSKPGLIASPEDSDWAN